jgi:hypothetical protein
MPKGTSRGAASLRRSDGLAPFPFSFPFPSLGKVGTGGGQSARWTRRLPPPPPSPGRGGSQANTGGRCEPQSHAWSYACPSRSTSRSAWIGPASCSPIGRPPSPNPARTFKVRQPRQRERRDDLHPAVVGVHSRPRCVGPVQLGVEGNTCAARRHHVSRSVRTASRTPGTPASGTAMPGTAAPRRAAGSAPSPSAFRLHQLRAELRVARRAAQLAAHQHLPQPQPGTPVVLARHVQRAGLHAAADVLQGVAAPSSHSSRCPAPAAGPARCGPASRCACPCSRRSGQRRRGSGSGSRTTAARARPSPPSCTAAAPRPRRCAPSGRRWPSCWKNTSSSGLRRHAPARRPQADDVVEGRRDCAASRRHVAAVGHRQHAERQRHGRAAAAAARGLRSVPGIARDAEHGVEGVRAQPELGVLVLPMTMAPAAFMRCREQASVRAMRRPAVSGEPSVVGRPARRSGPSPRSGSRASSRAARRARGLASRSSGFGQQAAPSRSETMALCSGVQRAMRASAGLHQLRGRRCRARRCGGRVRWR